MPGIQCPDVGEIVAVMRGKKYKVFENPNGHDINLVGKRRLWQLTPLLDPTW